MKCPHCTTELPDFSRFCSRCGREVDPSRSAMTYGSTKVCSSCGSINAMNMSRCGACGMSLEGRAPTAAPPAPPPPLAAIAQRMRNDCPRCGAVLADASRCPACGWTEAPAPEPSQGLGIALNAASLLLFGAGVLGIISIILSFYQMSDPDLFGEVGLTSQMVDVVKGVVACCITIVGIATVFAFLTALMIRSRKGSFSLYLGGAGIAILTVGPFYSASVLALIALILIAISGKEFE